MRKNDESRIRVERMLRGDCRIDDISRLLRSLRGRTFGRGTVKDVADLTAHEDDRNQGMMFDAVSNIYYSTLLFSHAQDNNNVVNLNRLPPYIVKSLNAGFDSLSIEDLKRKSVFNRKSARDLLDSAIAKLSANSDGTLNGTLFNRSEMSVVQAVISTIRIQPAYTADHVFKDLVYVLQKNKILRVEEVRAFADLKDKFSIFILSLLHRLDMIMPDNKITQLQCEYSGEEDGRKLNVVASFRMVEDRAIYLAFSVFKTELLAKDHCDPLLFDLANLGNNIPENPGRWEIPIEIGPDWKLRCMLV